MSPRFALIAVLTFTGLLAAAEPGHAEAPFHLSAPERLPFLPSIVKNERPDLCAFVDREHRRGFLATGLATFADNAAIRPFEPDVLNFPGAAYDVAFPRVDIDVDNDGSPEVVVIRDDWQGGTPRPVRSVAVFENEKAFFDRISASRVIFDVFKPTAGDRDLGQALIEGVRLDVGAREPIQFTAGGDSPFVFFVFAGRTYVYLGEARSQVPRRYAAVVEIGRGRRLAPLCAFRIGLDPHDAPSVLTQSAFRGFDEFLSLMRGVQPACGGTYHPEVFLNTNRAWILYAASLAPWRLELFPYARTPPNPNARFNVEDDTRTVRRAFAWWREQGVWNFRRYGELEGHITAASRELATYYSTGFGFAPGAAMKIARTAVSAMMIRTFTFSSDVDEGTGVLAAYMAGLQLPYEYAAAESARARLLHAEITNALRGKAQLTALLKRALLYFSEPKTIRALIDAGADVNAGEESALFFALNSKTHVELILAAGADVNHVNAIGKTALMYASQFGDDRIVRLLLDHGADPNLATRKLERCNDYDVRVGGRTALMYAAESARGPALLKILVDAGADIQAMDSQGRRAIDYLARNEAARTGETMRALLTQPRR